MISTGSVRQFAWGNGHQISISNRRVERPKGEKESARTHTPERTEGGGRRFIGFTPWRTPESLGGMLLWLVSPIVVMQCLLLTMGAPAKVGREEKHVRESNQEGGRRSRNNTQQALSLSLFLSLG